MNLSNLGYTRKWLEFGFINEEVVEAQLKELESNKDLNSAHFRSITLKNWTDSKERVTNTDLTQFLVIAREETDQKLAGEALSYLFTSPCISNDQFQLLSTVLPEFGDWTRKLIIRESLKKEIEQDEIDEELLEQCLGYRNEFKDNRLLFLIVEKSNNKNIIKQVLDSKVGKRLKTTAQKKLDKLNR